MSRLLLLGIALALVVGCHGKRPANIGVTEGLLAPCPSTPNCVSTQAGDEQHKINPIPYSGAMTEARDRMTGIVKSMKRTRVVTSADNYIHAEFTSALWRFVDDVEFYFDDENKLIHFRSASRLGKSDLGVNRKRMNEIIRRYGGK